MQRQYPISYINDISAHTNSQPSPLLLFLAHLSQLLSDYQLDVSLQHLEILNPIESQYSPQSVSVSIKLAGRLNISNFTQKIDQLVQKLSVPYKPLCTTDQEGEAYSLLPSTTSIINLTKYSSVEQFYKLQWWQSLSAQNAFGVSKKSSIEVYVFCLNQQEQLLHFILQQPPSVAGSLQTFARELMNLFQRSRQAGLAQQGREDIHSARSVGKTADLLSVREFEVLQCIAEGLSNREIAQRCVIAEGTVKRHTNNIYSKLGVRSRTQALIQAKILGLLFA